MVYVNRAIYSKFMESGSRITIVVVPHGTWLSVLVLFQIYFKIRVA